MTVCVSASTGEGSKEQLWLFSYSYFTKAVGVPPPPPHRPPTHSRSGADNDAAHSFEATVSQVQALPGEFHPPALEVLLLKDHQL